GCHLSGMIEPSGPMTEDPVSGLTWRWAFTLMSFASVIVAHAEDIQLRAVQVPNDASYWKTAGFVEMVPPMRLPTVKSTEDAIQVWVKVPDDGKISVEWLEGQQRFTLKFPPGTVADRVES